MTAPGRAMKLSAAAAVLALPACAHDPASVATPADLPDAFSRSGDTARPAPWWTGFDDPALTHLVETALSGEPGVRAAWARLAQARAAADRTGSDRFPDVNGSAGASVERTWNGDDADTARAAGAGGETTRETYTVGLSASYEGDLWGRIDARTDAARLDARADRQALRAAALSLSGEVADAWYRLVARRARVALLKEQLATNRDMVSVVAARVYNGQAPLSDLLRQRELVDRTRERLAGARGERRLVRNELAALLGRAPGTARIPEQATLPGAPPLPDTGVPADLLRRRPDVREKLLRVKAADERVAAAVADRFPRLDLTAGLDSEAGVPADLFRTWLGSIAADLAVPLIDAGERRAEVARTKAVVAERLADFESTVITAVRDVEDALARMRRARAEIDRIREQIATARRTVDRLRGRYASGGADYLDVLDALTGVQDLRRRLVDARAARLTARVGLARALAGGVTPPRPGGRGFGALNDPQRTDRTHGTDAGNG